MYNLNLLNLADVGDFEMSSVVFPPMEMQAIEEPDYGPADQAVTEMHAASQTLDSSEEAANVLESVASALEPTIQESQNGVTDVHAMEALMLALAPLRVMAGAKPRSTRIAVENFGDRNLSYRETNLAIEDLKSVAMAAKDKIVAGIQWLIDKFKEFIKFITDADHRQMEKAKKLLEQAKTHAEVKGGKEVGFFDGLNFFKLSIGDAEIKPGSAGKIISDWSSTFQIIDNLVDGKEIINRIKKVTSLEGDQPDEAYYEVVKECISFNVTGLKHIHLDSFPRGYTGFVSPLVMGKRIGVVVPSGQDDHDFWSGVSSAGVMLLALKEDPAVLREAMNNKEGVLSFDNKECAALAQAAIMHITARLNVQKSYNEMVKAVEEMKNHITDLQKKVTSDKESDEAINGVRAVNNIKYVGRVLSRTALSGMSTIQSLSAKQCAVVLKVVAASLHANGQTSEDDRAKNAKSADYVSDSKEVAVA